MPICYTLLRTAISARKCNYINSSNSIWVNMICSVSFSIKLKVLLNHEVWTKQQGEWNLSPECGIISKDWWNCETELKCHTLIPTYKFSHFFQSFYCNYLDDLFTSTHVRPAFPPPPRLAGTPAWYGPLLPYPRLRLNDGSFYWEKVKWLRMSASVYIPAMVHAWWRNTSQSCVRKFWRPSEAAARIVSGWK